MTYLNSWLLSLEGLYLVTIWFEYFSITQAYRLNQKLAKQQDKIPLTSQIIVKERIGYFLEWLFGALAIWGASYLIYLGTFGFIYFIIALFPLFFIRNFLYSFVANLYYDHQQAKQLQHYQQVKNATQGDK